MLDLRSMVSTARQQSIEGNVFSRLSVVRGGPYTWLRLHLCTGT